MEHYQIHQVSNNSSKSQVFYVIRIYYFLSLSSVSSCIFFCFHLTGNNDLISIPLDQDSSLDLDFGESPLSPLIKAAGMFIVSQSTPTAPVPLSDIVINPKSSNVSQISNLESVDLIDSMYK